MERTSSVPIERKLELTRYLREKSHYNHQQMKRQEQILYGDYPFQEESEVQQHVPYWQLRLLISSIILGVLLYCNYANLSIGSITYDMVNTTIKENDNLAELAKTYGNNLNIDNLMNLVLNNKSKKE